MRHRHRSPSAAPTAVLTPKFGCDEKGILSCDRSAQSMNCRMLVGPSDSSARDGNSGVYRNRRAVSGNQTMLLRMARPIQYLGIGFVVIVILGLAIAPFSNRLIEQWSRCVVVVWFWFVFFAFLFLVV